MLSMGHECGRFLVELGNRDERIWALDGDLADSNGAFEFSKCYPDRFVMAGIAEQSLVSVAAGLATCGKRPWVFSFAAFLCYRAYDQIRVCVSQTRLPVTLIGSHSGGCCGRNGKTHTALSDIALMASLPNICIWSPADHEDLHFAMRTIAASQNPAYIRLPREPLQTLDGIASTVRIFGAASPITIISTGIATHWSLEAQELLQNRGLLSQVIHCARIHPLPKDELEDVILNSKHIIVVEDHYSFGGLSSLIDKLGIKGKVWRLGWPEDWSGKSGDSEQLLYNYGPHPYRIVDTVESIYRWTQ